MTSTVLDLGIAGIEVTEGPVPQRLDRATYTGPLDTAEPGRYLLRLPGVGAFLVEDGVRVTLQRSPTATDADVACLLAGPVRQVCWLQQGRFALRGCGVVIGGRAVAITGPCAAGKSAVTAALAQRGHELLADGALPVRLDGGLDVDAVGRGPIADTVDDTVQLWPDTVRQLGLDPSGGEVIRPGLTKRRYRFGAAAAAPLVAVVVLRRLADIGPPSAEAIRGHETVDAMMTYTAMRPVLAAATATVRQFRWGTRIAAAVRVVNLCADRHRRDLPVVADAVESLVASTGPGRW